MYAGIQEWWNQPYSDAMSVPKWFLFLGMLMVLGVVWKFVTVHAMEIV